MGLRPLVRGAGVEPAAAVGTSSSVDIWILDFAAVPAAHDPDGRSLADLNPEKVAFKCVAYN